MAVTLLAGEKATGETRKATIACNDYLRMGAGRSLAKLHQKYMETTTTTPPTRNLRVIGGWSQKYGWQERAETYDAQVEAEKNAERKRIMSEGLSLDYERVRRLKELADKLHGEIEGAVSAAEADSDDEGEGDSENEGDGEPGEAAGHGIWLRDWKQIGGGEYASVVEIERFNNALLEQYRSTLDDIAKETGGRRQRTTVENIDYGKLTEEQLARIADGEDPIQVILSDYSSR